MPTGRYPSVTHNSDIASIGLLLGNAAQRYRISEQLMHAGWHVNILAELANAAQLPLIPAILGEEASARRHGAELSSLKQLRHPLYLSLLLLLPADAEAASWLRMG